MNLKEEAQNFVPQKTKNIADLDKIPVDIEVFERTAKEGTPEEFTYKYVMVDEIEYRIPGIVLGSIKHILEKQPKCKYVQVTKEGEGKTNTRYFVIPWLDNSK